MQASANESINRHQGSTLQEVTTLEHLIFVICHRHRGKQTLTGPTPQQYLLTRAHLDNAHVKVEVTHERL